MNKTIFRDDPTTTLRLYEMEENMCKKEAAALEPMQTAIDQVLSRLDQIESS